MSKLSEALFAGNRELSETEVNNKFNFTFETRDGETYDITASDSDDAITNFHKAYPYIQDDDIIAFYDESDIHYCPISGEELDEFLDVGAPNINLNLDASGQSVGILGGKGGDADDDDDEVDEGLVGDVAGGIGNVVDRIGKKLPIIGGLFEGTEDGFSVGDKVCYIDDDPKVPGEIVEIHEDGTCDVVVNDNSGDIINVDMKMLDYWDDSQMECTMTEGSRIRYEDDFVKVFDGDDLIYKGIEDYEPMRYEPWEWNDKDECYYLNQDGKRYKKVCLESKLTEGTSNGQKLRESKGTELKFSDGTSDENWNRVLKFPDGNSEYYVEYKFYGENEQEQRGHVITSDFEALEDTFNNCEYIEYWDYLDTVHEDSSTPVTEDTVRKSNGKLKESYDGLDLGKLAPFTDTDFRGYAGAEWIGQKERPLIYHRDNFDVLVDDNGIEVYDYTDMDDDVGYRLDISSLSEKVRIANDIIRDLNSILDNQGSSEDVREMLVDINDFELYESLTEDTVRKSNGKKIKESKTTRGVYYDRSRVEYLIDEVFRELGLEEKDLDDVDSTVWSAIYKKFRKDGYPEKDVKDILKDMHWISDDLVEDTVKKSNGKWTNRGDDGKEHGEFDTKAEADAQRKAMFANK